MSTMCLLRSFAEVDPPASFSVEICLNALCLDGPLGDVFAEKMQLSTQLNKIQHSSGRHSLSRHPRQKAVRLP